MPLSNIEPARYDELLADKVVDTRALFAPFDAPAPDVFNSTPTGYRLRAEFRMWHEGDGLDYVMFRRDDPRTPVPVTHFPPADARIQALMPVLRDHLKNADVLRRKLFQVEFLATLSGQVLVTLAYHRRLDEQWQEAVEQLQANLQGDFPGLSFVGRSRKQKLVVGADHVIETLAVHGREYHYRQYEQAFTQPNGRVNIHMIEWACDRAADCSGDLLELYCGNGNFTLPLSTRFANVIATELSKTSAKAARENIAANGIDNIQLVRLSAEETAEAMAGVREFRRLAALPRPLGEYPLQTIFVDPPRAGLDDDTVAMAAGFEHILYISCNPQTLAANLATLDKTHEIRRFALFDQFPYTHHMECGMHLVRRG